LAVVNKRFYVRPDRESHRFSVRDAVVDLYEAFQGLIAVRPLRIGDVPGNVS